MLLGDVCLDQDDGAAGVSPVTVLRPYGDAALCMCPDPDPRGCRASGTLTPPVPAAKAPSFPGWNCPLPRRGPDSAWGRPHLVAWSRAPGAKTPAGLRPPPAPGRRQVAKHPEACPAVAAPPTGSPRGPGGQVLRRQRPGSVLRAAPPAARGVRGLRAREAAASLTSIPAGRPPSGAEGP